MYPLSGLVFLLLLFDMFIFYEISTNDDSPALGKFRVRSLQASAPGVSSADPHTPCVMHVLCKHTLLNTDG